MLAASLFLFLGGISLTGISLLMANLKGFYIFLGISLLITIIGIILTIYDILIMIL